VTQPLHEIVRVAAAQVPDRPAIIHRDRTITFGRLWDRVRATAGLIATIGEPGDRVAVIGENHPAWVDCLYGVPAAGRILTFVNHRLAPAEVDSILKRSGAAALIGAPQHAVGHSLPTWSFEDWDETLSRQVPPEPRQTTADGAAWLIYTSGTTAEPKGAILTPASLRSAIEATTAVRPIRADDVYVFPFPLCHVAAYNVVHHQWRQRPVVLLDRFEPGAFIEATDRHGATSTSVAATMLSALLDVAEPDPAARHGLRTLRSVAYGAAPMPVPVLQRADRILGVEFAQGYGMTELSGNAVFLGPEDHRIGLASDPDRLRAAGRPAPGVEVRTAEDGEILIRAGQVMAGYWDDPEGSAAALAGGWLHTGDIGRIDGSGLLSILDRKKDLIVTGGENVSSLEVEQAIATVPGVREVAVIGIPDPHWGENVCAVVAPTAGATVDPDDLIRAVRRRVAGFKAPRHVVIVDELPRNGSGKVVKAELRARLAADPGLLGPRR
jgi:acyl-CoA synthetase (AMP-forming)/AMP-acid ligase II